MFSRMTRPKVFTTGATDAKMYADRKFSAPCATERFCNWLEWCKNERRPNNFSTGAAEAQVSADRIVFAPGATENFNDWRERCKNESRSKFFCLVRPKQKSLRTAFFCNWCDRSTSDRRPKRFCVYRDRNFFDWRDRSKSFRRQKSICDWRDRSTIDSLPQFFCNWGDCSTNERRPNNFSTGAAEAQVSADRIVFAPGATQNFNDWRERCKNESRSKFFCLVRPKQKKFADRNFLQLMWAKHEGPPTKAFLRLSRQKFFRLAWPKQKFPPTEVCLRLARP